MPSHTIDLTKDNEDQTASPESPQDDVPKRFSGMESPPFTSTAPLIRHAGQDTQSPRAINDANEAEETGLRILLYHDAQSPKSLSTLEQRLETSRQHLPSPNGEKTPARQQPSAHQNPDVGQGDRVDYLLEILYSKTVSAGKYLACFSDPTGGKRPASAGQKLQRCTRLCRRVDQSHLPRPRYVKRGFLRRWTNYYWRSGNLGGQQTSSTRWRSGTGIDVVGGLVLQAGITRYVDIIFQSRHILMAPSGVGSERFKDASTNRVLAEAGWQYSLNEFVVGDGGVSVTELNCWRMATTDEAIIGAVWLDSSRDIMAVKRALTGFLGEDRVDSVMKRASPDYSPYE